MSSCPLENNGNLNLFFFLDLNFLRTSFNNFRLWVPGTPLVKNKFEILLDKFFLSFLPK